MCSKEEEMATHKVSIQGILKVSVFGYGIELKIQQPFLC